MSILCRILCRAQNLLEEAGSSNSNPTLVESSPVSIVSPNKRRGSAEYWKSKFEQAQNLIKDLGEKSIALEEVPGLLSIKKFKPATEKKSVRVTNVYGSMRAKDVASQVQVIKEKKKEVEKVKKDKANQKEENKANFLKCKDKCTCSEEKCLAIGLKQCPVCKNVLRSLCSKAACKVDGQKPVMILPAKASSSKKTLDDSDESEEEDIDMSEESTLEDETYEDEEDKENNDPEEQAIVDMQKVWNTIKPPVKEADIIGKWYAVCFQTKRKTSLFVGKICKRFLTEEDGDVDKVEIRCLKAKIGQGTTLEDTPQHLPDIGLFKMEDIIAGPLKATPMKGNKFYVPEYPSVKERFAIVSKLNRNTYLPY
uniref:Uncharacterized protein n=1 Tax=Clytia hemisphaerica TaxID=252671 RepID=A0A7M5XKL4_9CNID